MNIDDTAKLLANRINQKHDVQFYLFRCFSFGIVKGEKDAISKYKVSEMRKMLESVLQLQKDNYGNGINTHMALIGKAKEIEQLIKEATEI